MVLIHSSLSDVIKESVSLAMEGMAFTEVERSVNQINLEDELIWSKLEIKEPYKGHIMLIFPRGLASELAANMFGMDEEPSLDVVKDSLAELLNTLTGIFMARIVSENDLFMLDVPVNGDGCPSKIDGAECYEDNFSVCGQSFKIVLSGKEILDVVVS